MYWKKIGTTTGDNREGKRDSPLVFNVTQSESSGSELNFGIEVSAEFSVAWAAKFGTKVSGGIKTTRSTNEARGASYTYIIPPGERGKIAAYWGGQQTSGQLKYYIVDPTMPNGAPNRVIHYTTNTGVSTVHTAYFDVNFIGSPY